MHNNLTKLTDCIIRFESWLNSLEEIARAETLISTGQILSIERIKGVWTVIYTNVEKTKPLRDCKVEEKILAIGHLPALVQSFDVAYQELNRRALAAVEEFNTWFSPESSNPPIVLP